MLHFIKIRNFKTHSGKVYDIPLSYQIFGCPLHTAPIVVVNHALTGNSNVAGEKGWWKTIVGLGKPIDIRYFTVIAFNIPGNGYDGWMVSNCRDFKIIDIAHLFLQGLIELGISRLKLLIGGSLGGVIAWEMLAQFPELAELFVPIATDFKTTDWLHSQCLVQQYLLEQSDRPLQKARAHAMLCYRTPQSLNKRFQREIDEEKGLFKSHDWLNYHGEALNERFSLKAYQLMNYLLMTANTAESSLQKIKADIHLIAVDSDWFFPAFEIRKCWEDLSQAKDNVFYHEIESIHGHDAFLIEYEQLNVMIKNILHSGQYKGR